VKSRVDDLLNWLAGRSSSCLACGSVLVAIAGNGVRAAVCPSCDVTPGVEQPPERPHDRVHGLAVPGCASCRQRWGIL
jgi:hypothetical protein